MVRTQVQLPDDLYEQIKRIAAAREWSVGEVLRRGAEIAVQQYRQPSSTPWKLPDPRPLGLRVPADSLRDLIADDESPKSH